MYSKVKPTHILKYSKVKPTHIHNESKVKPTYILKPDGTPAYIQP